MQVIDKIKDIEEKVIQLTETKNNLIQELQTTQRNLSTIKRDFKADTVLASELKRINKLRKDLVEDSNKTADKLREINTQIKNLNTEKNQLQYNGPKKKVEANNVVKDKVLALQKYYVNFNRDKTRIPAMRKMSEQFIDDLEKILKSF